MSCRIIEGVKYAGSTVWGGITSAANGCKKAACTVVDKVEEAGRAVNRGYNLLGRKIERLCDKHLPGPLNTVAKDAYWGAPTTAVLALSIPPGLGLLAASVTLISTRILEAMGKIKPKTAECIYKGVRNFCVIGSVAEIVRTGLTGNPIFLITLPFYAMLGLSAHVLAETAQARRAFGIF